MSKMEITVKITEEMLNNILTVLQEIQEFDSIGVDKIVFYK